MNLAGISVLVGLLVLALYTLPYGIAVIAAMAWLFLKN